MAILTSAAKGSALTAAEMDNNWTDLDASKAATSAGGVVASGTTCTRTPAANAPSGHFNRLLTCAGGSLTVNTAGTIAADIFSVRNTHASNNLNLNFPATQTFTVAPGERIEIERDSAGVWTRISFNAADARAALATDLAAKAQKFDPVTISASGTFDLTEALHDGRRIIVNAAGVVLTNTVPFGATAVGCTVVLQSGSYTLGAGITVPAGCASGSATAPGGSIDLLAIGGVLRSDTQVLVQLPVMAITSATAVTLTKALHGNKRVELTMPSSAEVVIDVAGAQGWAAGDQIELANASAAEFNVRSSTYAGLFPVENRRLCGENSFVRYMHNGTRFEAVGASFLFTGKNTGTTPGGRKTMVWLGDHGSAAEAGTVGQEAYVSGPNMDMAIGNGRFDMQVNLGGSTFAGSPNQAWIGISTTIYKSKNIYGTNYPAYGQQTYPHIGLTLGYYSDNGQGIGDSQQDKLKIEFAQSGLHNTDAVARALGPLATDQGERNWSLYRGAPLTIAVMPPSTGNAAYASNWSGIAADWTERGTLLLRQAFGIASEFVDDGAAGSTHSATIPAGVSNVLLNKGGALTLVLPLVEGEEKSRDMRCSVIAAHTSIALTGTTVALGTLPLTAGSFFTLRWSPALAAWHRIG